jgi:hypothetical protein
MRLISTLFIRVALTPFFYTQAMITAGNPSGVAEFELQLNPIFARRGRDGLFHQPMVKLTAVNSWPPSIELVPEKATKPGNSTNEEGRWSRSLWDHW